ncbi:cell division protein FtsQ/DivIB [Rhizobium alvei]|uniref:cell division protein FtsQ/DivIB n=1 Tax=Rhizobium alvei TaxID=1132659 RepID=UPI003620A301
MDGGGRFVLALKRSNKDERYSLDDAAGSGGGLVLPKPLRRVVRFLGSLGSGRVDIPRHLGTVSVLAFYAATGLYAFALNGDTSTVSQSVTSAAGFAINNVKVSGNNETSEIDILERLGLDGTTSLMALDVAATRTSLRGLPWVQDAEVRKVYPDTVEIKLTERKAFGIWQHGEELSLIEQDGSVIAPLRDNKFASLPLFVGRDAKTGAADVVADFDRWPAVKSRVKAYMRVAGRRWDLLLDNGVMVKLPEHGVDRAMEMLASLEGDHQLLERDIAAVDFRLNDRTTIQLTPEAAARRKQAVEARAKAFKKAGIEL